jgi:hypothetical protein
MSQIPVVNGCGVVFHLIVSLMYGIILRINIRLLMSANMSSVDIAYCIKKFSLGICPDGNAGKCLLRSAASWNVFPSSITSFRKRSSSAVNTIREFPDASHILVSRSCHLRVKPS